MTGYDLTFEAEQAGEDLLEILQRLPKDLGITDLIVAKEST